MCICLCLHLCITVIYLSISLEVTGSVFLFLLFLLIFHLTHPSFSSLWISLTCSLYLGFFFQLSLLWQLGEWYTVLYLTSSVTTANSQTSCISNSSLVKQDRNSPSTSFPELLWEGYSGVATAMLVAVMLRLPIYQAPYMHHFTIPKISYLEDLNRYIPPFYWRGHWDPTWSYGLPNITEQNLYSNLCIFHRICIKIL